MRAVLFCKNPYAFGILEPINHVLQNREDTSLWYVPAELMASFPFSAGADTCSSMKELMRFNPDVIFVPGNEVPHYLRGVKAQIFHGLAGEKKGHFRVRHYFDLYLTQGPYFTKRFRELAGKYGNFDVFETGWPKLDPLFRRKTESDRNEQQAAKSSAGQLKVLYAPTFSPSLTSANALLHAMERLAGENDRHILLKFHDLMDSGLKRQYALLAQNLSNISLVEEPDIVPLLLEADVLISDTSSVVYEFLLLDKPVITYKTRTPHPAWQNIEDAAQLPLALDRALTADPCRLYRKEIIEQYHPYTDGSSAERMIEAAESYIKRNGVPEYRKLSILRRWKMNRMFGKKPEGNE